MDSGSFSSAKRVIDAATLALINRHLARMGAALTTPRVAAAAEAGQLGGTACAAKKEQMLTLIKKEREADRKYICVVDAMIALLGDRETRPPSSAAS